MILPRSLESPYGPIFKGSWKLQVNLSANVRKDLGPILTPSAPKASRGGGGDPARGSRAGSGGPGRLSLRGAVGT